MFSSFVDYLLNNHMELLAWNSALNVINIVLCAYLYKPKHVRIIAMLSFVTFTNIITFPFFIWKFANKVIRELND